MAIKPGVISQINSGPVMSPELTGETPTLNSHITLQDGVDGFDLLQHETTTPSTETKPTDIPSRDVDTRRAPRNFARIVASAAGVIMGFIGPTAAASAQLDSPKPAVAANVRENPSPNLVQQQTSTEYPYLDPREAGLLKKLSNYHYPDEVVASYSTTPGQEKATLLKITQDIAAVLNTNDYDGYARMFGGTKLTDLNDSSSDEFVQMSFLFAPDEDMQNIRLVSATDLGNEVKYVGYVPLFTFDNSYKGNSKWVKFQIKNALRKGYPTTGQISYLELQDVRVSKTTGKITYFTWYMNNREPKY